VAIPSWALGTGGTRLGDSVVAANHGILKKKLKTLDIDALNKSRRHLFAYSVDIPENAAYKSTHCTK
jgi:hypothetical protein